MKNPSGDKETKPRAAERGHEILTDRTGSLSGRRVDSSGRLQDGYLSVCVQDATLILTYHLIARGGETPVAVNILESGSVKIGFVAENCPFLKVQREIQVRVTSKEKRDIKYIFIKNSYY